MHNIQYGWVSGTDRASISSTLLPYFTTGTELGTTSISTIMITIMITTQQQQQKARSEQNIKLANVIHEWAKKFLCIQIQ